MLTCQGNADFTVSAGTTTQHHAFALTLAWLNVLAAKDFSDTFTQVKRFDLSPTPFDPNLRFAQLTQRPSTLFETTTSEFHPRVPRVVVRVWVPVPTVPGTCLTPPTVLSMGVPPFRRVPPEGGPQGPGLSGNSPLPLQKYSSRCASPCPQQ